MTWIRIAKRPQHHWNRVVQVIAHISCQSVEESVELAQHAAGLGVAAIGYMVPAFFKPKNQADVADLLVRVAKSVPSAPVIYYHFPGTLCGRRWSSLLRPRMSHGLHFAFLTQV